MYNFTNFTIMLNELEPGMEGLLAPTDCRLRPDIRAMENGNMGNVVLFLHKSTNIARTPPAGVVVYKIK